MIDTDFLFFFLGDYLLTGLGHRLSYYLSSSW